MTKMICTLLFFLLFTATSFSQTREEIIECLKTVLELPELDPAFEQEWGEEKFTCLQLTVLPYQELPPIDNPIAPINSSDFRGFKRPFHLMGNEEDERVQDLTQEKLFLLASVRYGPRNVTIHISGRLPVYPIRYLESRFILAERAGSWAIEKQLVNIRAY